jgi:hypothetical protein
MGTDSRTDGLPVRARSVQACEYAGARASARGRQPMMSMSVLGGIASFFPALAIFEVCAFSEPAYWLRVWWGLGDYWVCPSILFGVTGSVGLGSSIGIHFRPSRALQWAATAAVLHWTCTFLILAPASLDQSHARAVFPKPEALVLVWTSFLWTGNTLLLWKWSDCSRRFLKNRPYVDSGKKRAGATSAGLSSQAVSCRETTWGRRWIAPLIVAGLIASCCPALYLGAMSIIFDLVDTINTLRGTNPVRQGIYVVWIAAVAASLVLGLGCCYAMHRSPKHAVLGCAGGAMTSVIALLVVALGEAYLRPGWFVHGAQAGIVCFFRQVHGFALLLNGIVWLSILVLAWRGIPPLTQEADWPPIRSEEGVDEKGADD